MSFFYKLLEKFAQMLVPTGAVLPFIGTEVPEGFILWQEYKIYESQLPKLYARYSTVENFTKGSDSTGNYVQLPSINDRTLQACSSFSLVGKLLAAALPNITGTIGWGDVGLFTVVNGAFTGNPRGNENAAAEWANNAKPTPYKSATLNLSTGNALYSGSSLQPASAQVLMIIKV